MNPPVVVVNGSRPGVREVASRIFAVISSKEVFKPQAGETAAWDLLMTLFGRGKAFSCFAGHRTAGSHAPPLVGSLGRVVRIRNRHSGKYLGTPTLKLLAKVCRPTRLGLDQVLGFSNVIGQVVKFKIAAAIEVLD